MNAKLLLVMLLIMSISPLTLAENVRIHYKCHLALLDKSEVIHQFVSTETTQSEFEKGLVGRLVYFADGVSGSAIEIIYQCVKVDQRFTTRRARELEEKTPF